MRNLQRLHPLIALSNQGLRWLMIIVLIIQLFSAKSKWAVHRGLTPHSPKTRGFVSPLHRVKARSLGHAPARHRAQRPSQKIARSEERRVGKESRARWWAE